MVQFASYLRRVLSKTRLIFPRINGPNVSLDQAPQWGKRRKKKKNLLASLADFMFSYRCCFIPFFAFLTQGINQSQQSFASLNDKMNENIANSLVLPEVSASFEESFF